MQGWSAMPFVPAAGRPRPMTRPQVSRLLKLLPKQLPLFFTMRTMLPFATGRGCNGHGVAKRLPVRARRIVSLHICSSADDAVGSASGGLAPYAPFLARDIPPAVLEGVFGGLGLGVMPASSSGYLSHFVSFLRSTSVLGAATTDACCSILESLGTASAVSWTPFSEYGCSLVAVSSLGCNGFETARLHLLGPDQWAFNIEISCSSASPPVGLFVDLCVGELPRANLQALLETVATLLRKAKQKKGDQRSAAGGKQGHQKTPAFIEALVRDALKGAVEDRTVEDRTKHQPKGGFTDVGLHTGGEARVTGWPLSASVARFVMEQLCEPPGTHPDFRVILAEWEMWLLEASLGTAVRLSALARMLDSAASRSAALADAGLDTSALEARALHVREVLEASLASQIRGQAAAFLLPPLVASGGSIDGQSHRLPHLAIQPPLQADSAESSMVARRERALSNLSWLPLPPLSPISSPRQLLDWLALPRLTDERLQNVAPHLLVSGVEEWVFAAAARLLPLEPKMSAQEMAEEVDALERLGACLIPPGLALALTPVMHPQANATAPA